MKKIKLSGKLSLNKEAVKSLSDNQMQLAIGGKSITGPDEPTILTDCITDLTICFRPSRWVACPTKNGMECVGG